MARRQEHADREIQSRVKKDPKRSSSEKPRQDGGSAHGWFPLIRSHAFVQPSTSPLISNMSVHEKRLGQRWSIHAPKATPTNVGTATDQPTNPRIARDPHTSSFWVRARNARAFLDSTSRIMRSAEGGSFGGDGDTGLGILFQLQETPHQVRLQLRFG